MTHMTTVKTAVWNIILVCGVVCVWWLWPSCVRWGGGRTRVGASERQAHVRVRACALARARKGKERRGEKRRRRGKGEHTFVCDDKDDCSSGAVTWRVAFHEFARTRRARSRDRKHALMARARRRARVEHNRHCRGCVEVEGILLTPPSQLAQFCIFVCFA